MILLIDITLKLYLVFQFFYTLHLLVNEFDSFYLLRITIILTYLFLLSDSLSQSRTQGTKANALAYGHSFLPPILLTFTNSSISTDISLAILYMGTFIVIFGVISLRRCFSVVPFQTTTIKETGIYSSVRHPIYLGHLLVFLASTLSHNILSYICILIYIYVTVLRINLEEDFLSQNKKYLDYKLTVPNRLIPFVY